MPLGVFMNGRHVGQLERERSGAVIFTYAREWLEWDYTLPVSLSLPLRPDRYVGAAVMAVFDNLLPDYEPMRRRIAERTGASGTDALSLLGEIGRDCVGALQFLPEGEEPGVPGDLDGSPLEEGQIAALLKELDSAPLGLQRERDFRLSLAGAQEKTALLFNEGQWIKPVGATPTSHILKPRIGRLPNGMDLSDSVENEYLCLKLLEAFGLRVAQAEIAMFADQKALVVERFDRRRTATGRLLRLPQEDCCQALSVPPTRKYQSEGGPGITEIMQLLRGSDVPAQDRLDFFRANILFWLVGATDGHAKNFSLALQPGGRFRMAPLYDVLSVQPSVDHRQVGQRDFRLAMRMGRTHHYRLQDIQPRHMMETGVEAGLSREAVAVLLAEIARTAPAALEKTLAALPPDFPDYLSASITAAVELRSRQLL